MLIRLGFLSGPHSSLFSNLQKHLSSLTHHENKERENEGTHFVFNDVSMAYGLIAFCILYGSCFGVFDFFFEDGEKKLLYH